MSELVTIVQEPWGFITARGAAPLRVVLDGYGPAVFVPQEEKSRLGAFAVAFPRKSAHFTFDLKQWASFDLPTSLKTTARHKISLDGSTTHEFNLENQIGRIGCGRLNLSASDQSIQRRSESFVDAIVQIMLELRRAAEDYMAKSSMPIRVPYKYAALPWPELPEKLCLDRKEASMDVIVEIASEYLPALCELVERPRRILRRERKKTLLAKAQQIDAKCLQWLVQQPGRTPAEKAGSDQKILAIGRQEDFDTLENRVLKDFLKRCVDCSDMYLEQNRKYQHSQRHRVVSRLRLKCFRYLRAPFFDTIANLNQLASPNYALLHHSQYALLWKWYLRLVHRQRQSDEAWIWQRRLWADLIRLCMVASIIDMKSNFVTEWPFLQHLWIRDEHEFGSWAAPVDWPGPIEMIGHTGVSVFVEFVHPQSDREKLSSGALKLKHLVGLSGADMGIYFKGTNQQSHQALMVWAILSGADGNDALAVHESAKRLAKFLEDNKRTYCHNIQVSGLVVRSELGSSAVHDLPSVSEGDTRVDVLMLPADMNDWRTGALDYFKQLIFELLTKT